MKLFTIFLLFFSTLINLFDGVVNASTRLYIRGPSTHNWSNEEVSGRNRHSQINKDVNAWNGFKDEFQQFWGSDEGRILYGPIYGEIVKLITTDIYNNIKGAIRHFFRSLKRKIILLKIRGLLRKWWRFVLPKLEGGLKFSKSAKSKLRKCFYSSGIDAYKKIVLDLKEAKGEFFFMTLIEFKKRCVTDKYSDNSLLATNFKKLENGAAYLTHVNNLNHVEFHNSIRN